MSRDSFKRSRAGSGGRAAASSPKRYAPLRKVVSDAGAQETLECGHTQTAVFDMIGQTYAERRRCLTCLDEVCEEAGHPFDIERGGEPTCKCGKADGAISHLVWYHNVGGDPEPLRPLSDHLPADSVVDLAWASQQHEQLPATKAHRHDDHRGEWMRSGRLTLPRS